MTAGSVPPVISLRDICMTYASGEAEVRAVDQLSVDIQRGEFVAVMGISGSGKSTLMNIIGCLDPPTSGAYLLDGVAVSRLDRRQLAKLRNEKIGFVFQSFNLLARTTALENVELPLHYSEAVLPRRERLARATAALTRTGLANRLGHRPSQLSGGQQQRVAIARALINEPEVLLADEPTGNLDTRTSADVMGLFQSLNEAGITVVMVTHELDIAAYARRVLVMRDGRIIDDRSNDQRTIAHEEQARLQRAMVTARLDEDQGHVR